MNVAGARLARAGGRRGRAAASSPARSGPLNVTLSLSPQVDDPSFRARTFDEVVRRRTPSRSRGLRRGRRRPAADRDDLRHAEREGGDRGRARDVAPGAAALDLGHGRRPLAAARSRARRSRRSGSSIEHADPLIVGDQLLARRDGDAAVRRRARAARAVPRQLPPERRPAERVRRLRRDSRADDEPRCSASSRASGLRQRRRRLLRHDARAHRARSPRPCAGLPPRQVPQRRAAPRFSGLEPFEIGPDTGFVMIGERTNVTGSARFRRLIEADDFTGAVDVALEQVRGGANILDVNMDADLLDGEQAMTHLPEPDRDRARGRAAADHGRQLALVGARGRASSASRARGSSTRSASRRARRQFLEQARDGPPLRRRRRRDGLRRAGPGGRRSSARSRSAAAPTTCSPSEAGFPPEDIIFDPNVLAVATGIEEHDALRAGASSRRCR